MKKEEWDTNNRTHRMIRAVMLVFMGLAVLVLTVWHLENLASANSLFPLVCLVLGIVQIVLGIWGLIYIRRKPDENRSH